jgi:hypothetical protein
MRYWLVDATYLIANYQKTKDIGFPPFPGEDNLLITGNESIKTTLKQDILSSNLRAKIG